MLLHTEHFPLCLHPAVPLLLLRAQRLSMQALICPARSHVTVLINTHYTGLTFCSHKLLAEIKFSSSGNAACIHYSGLIILYGSPQNLQEKYATKGRCMSTTKTFNFYLLCKERYCTNVWVNYYQHGISKTFCESTNLFGHSYVWFHFALYSNYEWTNRKKE